jgi:hypothetical protein
MRVYKLVGTSPELKLCKDCLHRRFGFMGWKCRVGKHIIQKKITSPVTGRITVEFPGVFIGLPRCDDMRQEKHPFIIHPCGPDGVKWEPKRLQLGSSGE